MRSPCSARATRAASFARTGPSRSARPPPARRRPARRRASRAAACTPGCSRRRLATPVRPRLSHVICHGLRAGREELAVLPLHPRIEGQVTEQMRGGGALVIEPRLAEQLIRGLAPLAENMMRDGLTPVLLCGPEV